LGILSMKLVISQKKCMLEGEQKAPNLVSLKNNY